MQTNLGESAKAVPMLSDGRGRRTGGRAWLKCTCLTCVSLEFHLQPQKKKEKLKQEEINSANDWETQRDGAGPAWEAAMPSGLLQCPCLCNADICVTHLCVCCVLGVGVALSCV